MTIQELFGIDLPIIQAPMAGVQTSVLAVAVSNAGGLGSLPCAQLGIADIRRELGPISALPPKFPLATAAIAPLRAKAEAKGRGDFSPLWSGQNAYGCREIPAAELTRELAGALPKNN